MNNFILGILLLVVLVSCQIEPIVQENEPNEPIVRPVTSRKGPMAYDKIGSLLEPEDVFTEEDLDYTYRTVYGEVRNQSDAEIKAVCQVIYNRWSSDNTNASLKDIVLQRKQFSVWNYDDPNRPLLLDALVNTKPGFDKIKTICREVFAIRLKGIDLSKGINHYYHPKSMKLKCLASRTIYFYHKKGIKQKFKLKKPKRHCTKWGRPPPKWASSYEYKKRIGEGIFFVKQLP